MRRLPRYESPEMGTLSPKGSGDSSIERYVRSRDRDTENEQRSLRWKQVLAMRSRGKLVKNSVPSSSLNRALFVDASEVSHRVPEHFVPPRMSSHCVVFFNQHERLVLEGKPFAISIPSVPIARNSEPRLDVFPRKFTLRPRDRACLPCFLYKCRCDFQRPCLRCVSQGKTICCLDRNPEKSCKSCVLENHPCDQQRPCKRCVTMNRAQFCVDRDHKLKKAPKARKSVPFNSQLPLNAQDTLTYTSQVAFLPISKQVQSDLMLNSGFPFPKKKRKLIESQVS